MFMKKILFQFSYLFWVFFCNSSPENIFGVANNGSGFDVTRQNQHFPNLSISFQQNGDSLFLTNTIQPIQNQGQDLHVNYDTSYQIDNFWYSFKEWQLKNIILSFDLFFSVRQWKWLMTTFYFNLRILLFTILAMIWWSQGILINLSIYFLLSISVFAIQKLSSFFPFSTSDSNQTDKNEYCLNGQNQVETFEFSSSDIVNL